MQARREAAAGVHALADLLHRPRLLVHLEHLPSCSVCPPSACIRAQAVAACPVPAAPARCCHGMACCRRDAVHAFPGLSDLLVMSCAGPGLPDWRLLPCWTGPPAAASLKPPHSSGHHYDCNQAAHTWTQEAAAARDWASATAAARASSSSRALLFLRLPLPKSGMAAAGACSTAKVEELAAHTCEDNA